MIRKQKGRTVISICPVLQSDLSLLNEGLWVHGERHVSLQAASTQDKDVECACIPHRSLRQSSGGSAPGLPVNKVRLHTTGAAGASSAPHTAQQSSVTLPYLFGSDESLPRHLLTAIEGLGAW